MLTLITAALVAAQPAAPASPHAQHEGIKKDCCCKDCCKGMGKGEHDEHAPRAQPQPDR